MNRNLQKPSAAFIGASWAVLLVGSVTYLIGLWNATVPLNEKGYYFTILMYGLFRPSRCKRACATEWRASASRASITVCAGPR